MRTERTPMAKIKNIKDGATNYFKGQEGHLPLKEVDLFGEKYNTEILPSKYFIHHFGELFNTYVFNAKIVIEDFIEQLFKKYKLNESNYIYKYLHAQDDNLREIEYGSSEFLIKVKDKLLLFINNDHFKIWYGSSLSFQEVEKIIALIEKSKEKIVFKKKFSMVVATDDAEFGFDLQEFELNEHYINLDDNYNDDFIPIHKLIFDFLKTTNANGLVLLHGKFGTGKTSYIRHIISTVNKRVIFLPLDLIDSISSPGFLPFISQYRDCVLILEDCEELLRPREGGSFKASGIANLLNLGDGLLADALSIKIICTFNAELKFIDKAILRKGRLVARYEFNELDVEKAQKLSKKLGFKTTIDKPLTLAEIFNQQLEDFNMNKSSEYKKLGF